MLALTCPGSLRLPHISATAVAIALAVVVTAVLLLRGPLRRALRAVLADVRAVHEVPARAAALWGGSLAFAALHATVVVAVAQALELPLPPGPGGAGLPRREQRRRTPADPRWIGSLDAALAVALTLAGVPGSAAASVVLGDRLLTVWLPRSPGCWHWPYWPAARSSSPPRLRLSCVRCRALAERRRAPQGGSSR